MKTTSVYEGPVIGLSVGVKRTGVCALDGVGGVDALTSVATGELNAFLDVLEEESGVPAVVVADQALVEDAPEGFRGFERAFCKGLFSNSQVGLEPKDPGLPGPKLGPLKWWLRNHGLCWSNEFPAPGGVTRECDPNVALGLLLEPKALLEHRHALRFRYGRGKYLAPAVVAFDLLAQQQTSQPFFQPLLGDTPPSWEWLEGISHTSFEQKASSQGDELIAALVCGLLASYEMAGSATRVQAEDGHYLLPPLEQVHEGWKQELAWILKNHDFASVQHPFKEP